MQTDLQIQLNRKFPILKQRQRQKSLATNLQETMCQQECMYSWCWAQFRQMCRYSCTASFHTETAAAHYMYMQLQISKKLCSHSLDRCVDTVYNRQFHSLPSLSTLTLYAFVQSITLYKISQLQKHQIQHTNLQLRDRQALVCTCIHDCTNMCTQSFQRLGVHPCSNVYTWRYQERIKRACNYNLWYYKWTGVYV